MATARTMLSTRVLAEQVVGPLAAAGLAASRSGALKQGLACRKLMPDQDAEAVSERSAEWNSSLRPNNPWELWLVERISVGSLRVDRCTRQESALRGRLAHRAESCWDDDRRAEADDLARHLSRDPAAIRSALEATRFGCEWLIARWEGLLAVLDDAGAWDHAQATLARELLGTTAEAATAESARLEFERLTTKRDCVLKPIDLGDRALAESGLGPDPSGEIRRVRRYETSCLRRLEWAVSQLKKGRRDHVDHDPRPDWQAGPPSGPEMDWDADEFGPSPTIEAPAFAPFAASPVSRAEIRPLAATGQGAPTLAGALRDRVRGSHPGKNRRSRRAARN